MTDLKAIAKSHKGIRMRLLFIAVLTGLTVIGQAYFFVTIVDRVFLQGYSFTEILPFLAGLLSVLAARAALTYLNGITGVKLAAKVKKELRASLLKKLSKSPIQAALQGQSGQKVSVMMDAVDEVDSYFSKYVPQVMQSSIVPLIILIAAFSQHVNSGLIILVTAPFIPIFMIVVGLKTKNKSEEQMEKLNAFSGTFLDTLQGLTTLKLFNRSQKQEHTIENSSLSFRDATMEVLKIAFLSALMLEFISMLAIGLIALEAGFQLVVFENISFFTAFFVLVLAPEFYLYLKELGSAFHTGRGSMGAAQKIFDELNKEEAAMEWGNEELPDKLTPPAIELKHAGFQYGAEGFSIKGVEAKLPPFSQVALVGKSGSGKSTLLNLISGLIRPSEGTVVIDGKPLFTYQEKTWFDQVSYISQHPYIFAGTIAENMIIGAKTEATVEELNLAAKKAGIFTLIQSLPQGFQTNIGEGGRGLSGGEKQRLALARAFLKKPSIILFDEPTTGLDLQTEKILQASLRELSEHATVITVAHRLHTIKNADLILFLDNGNLLAKGSHTELLEKVPAYKEMVSIQQGGNAE